jgi:hypothetical protein
MTVSMLEIAEFFNVLGTRNRITRLQQRVVSQVDAFIRQHISPHQPLSSLVLYPAVQDHCSIDFSSLRQALRRALLRTTPLGDLHVGKGGLVLPSSLYKATCGRVCIYILPCESALLYPLPSHRQSSDIIIATLIRYHEILCVPRRTDLCISSCSCWSCHPLRKLSYHRSSSPNWSTSTGYPLASFPIANLPERAQLYLSWRSNRHSHTQRQMHADSLRHPRISSKQDVQSGSLPWWLRKRV